MSNFKLGLSEGTLSDETPQPFDVQHLYEQTQGQTGSEDLVPIRNCYTQVWIYHRIAFASFQWLYDCYKQAAQSANPHTVILRFHEVKSNRWWVAEAVMLEPEPGSIRPWGLEKAKVQFAFIRLIHDDTGATDSPFPELGPASIFLRQNRQDLPLTAAVPTPASLGLPLDLRVRQPASLGLPLTLRRVVPPSDWVQSAIGLPLTATTQPVQNAFAVLRSVEQTFPSPQAARTYTPLVWSWTSDRFTGLSNNRRYEMFASVKFLVQGVWTVWPSVFSSAPMTDIALGSECRFRIAIGNPALGESGGQFGQADTLLYADAMTATPRAVTTSVDGAGRPTFDFGLDTGDGSGVQPITFTVGAGQVGRWLGLKVSFQTPPPTASRTIELGLKFQAPGAAVLSGPPSAANGYDAKLQVQAERQYWPAYGRPSWTLSVRPTLDWGDPTWEGLLAHLTGFGASAADRFGYTLKVWSDPLLTPADPWSGNPTLAENSSPKTNWISRTSALTRSDFAGYGRHPWRESPPRATPDNAWLVKYAPHAWEWRCNLREWPSRRVSDDASRYDYYYAIAVYGADSTDGLPWFQDDWPNRVYRAPNLALAQSVGALAAGPNFSNLGNAVYYYFQEARWANGTDEASATTSLPAFILDARSPVFDDLCARMLLPVNATNADRGRWRFVFFQAGSRSYPLNLRWRCFVAPTWRLISVAKPAAFTLSLFVVDRGGFAQRTNGSIVDFWLEAPITVVARGTV